jgi:hypothetical protein
LVKLATPPAYDAKELAFYLNCQTGGRSGPKLTDILDPIRARVRTVSFTFKIS